MKRATTSKLQMSTLDVRYSPRQAGGRRVPPASRGLYRIAAPGLLLTLIPVVIGCLVSGKSSPLAAYESLLQWDGGWYEHIASTGYHCPETWADAQQCNLAFLPGYPLYARLIHRVTGLPMRHALLLGSQLAAWGFWTLLLLYLRRWRVPPGLATAGVLFLFTQPAAFYLVVGYSEALFLLALLGFLFWADTRRPAGEALAAVHGFIMAGTRIVGAPLALYPLARGWFSGMGRPRWRRAFWLLVVGGVVCLGTLSFFGFCWLRFGQWDAFFKAERFGWRVEADYRAVFSSRTWLPPYVRNPFDAQRHIDPEWLSRLTPPFLGGLFLLLLLGEIWFVWASSVASAPGGWRERIGYYLCALILFFTSVSGRYPLYMAGMIRYALPVLLLLMLAALHLLRHGGSITGWRRRVALSAFGLYCLAGFSLQVLYLYRYTHGQWVA